MLPEIIDFEGLLLASEIFACGCMASAIGAFLAFRAVKIGLSWLKRWD